MNRTQRRAVSRTGQHPITRELLNEAKRSHKLPAQVCALFVPDARGYVVSFCPHGFQVAETAQLARHYDEDEACSAALAFREVTGLRVAIRPVYLHKAAA